MGTCDIHIKASGMRKEQDFIVYPISSGSDASKITIQSDTRFGYIDMTTGTLSLTPAKNNANSWDFSIAEIDKTIKTDQLTQEEINQIKMEVFGTTNSMAGNNGIMYTDNGGAVNIL